MDDIKFLLLALIVVMMTSCSNLSGIEKELQTIRKIIAEA